MFELTLCLSIERQKYLSEFYKHLHPSIKKDAGIIIKHNSDGKSYLSIAVKEESKEYIKAKVLEFVTKVIENDFKYNFFRERIEVKSNNVLSEAFFRSISIFDEEIDKEVIGNLVSFSGEIVIESLFYFKLQPLVLRWQKTADIINHNFITCSDSSMIEVLRYLCAVSENNSVFVDLKFSEKQIELKNFLTTKKFNLNTSGISKMYEEIVKLNPTKINIKDKDGFGESYEITTTLLKVFNEKIYFV